MTDEVWKDVVGYEGLYAVSSHGRIFSYITEKYRKLKKRSKKDNYYEIGLNEDGYKKWFLVHRLVYQAFYKRSLNNSDFVYHLDGDTSNNHAINLAVRPRYGRHDNGFVRIVKRKTATKYYAIINVASGGQIMLGSYFTMQAAKQALKDYFS